MFTDTPVPFTAAVSPDATVELNAAYLEISYLKLKFDGNGFNENDTLPPETGSWIVKSWILPSIVKVSVPRTAFVGGYTTLI